ncbi:hypothetical protein [Pelomonas sp. KK5]|uniref:hypothetical protein n=1 Tax=Pelomonas sp. KK5 TaxID=1855730 RepID=UPI00117E27FF|nr:hypothetical protein [Pelomonas sp. KK5]
MIHPARTLALIAAILGTQSACVSVLTESGPVKEKLQLISAGHTGCLPQDNDVKVIAFHPGGDGVWNATCKDRKYLSTTTATTGSNVYSCALAQ